MKNFHERDLSGAAWHKSSYSGSANDDCLEVARWRKSTHSGGDGGNCLEATVAHPHIPVRDSKNPGPALVFRPEAWVSFVEDLKRD
ncbi:DUF397 domain-containing protein [Streptomyces brasiliscabiei]|uniref:DUF397 domain-containing protein n=1 Tax=Streptomyces brasiliscabiei TaxID=2736302 RepID=A0ABU8GPG1_9ACTN